MIDYVAPHSRTQSGYKRDSPRSGFTDGMILEEPSHVCQIPDVLRSGNVFQPNINDDLVFTKGTITRFLAPITSR